MYRNPRPVGLGQMVVPTPLQFPIRAHPEPIPEPIPMPNWVFSRAHSDSKSNKNDLYITILFLRGNQLGTGEKQLGTGMGSGMGSKWALAKWVPTFGIHFLAGLSWMASVSVGSGIHQQSIDFPCLERTWVALLMPLCSDQLDLVQLWGLGWFSIPLCRTVAKNMFS